MTDQKDLRSVLPHECDVSTVIRLMAVTIRQTFFKNARVLSTGAVVKVLTQGLRC